MHDRPIDVCVVGLGYIGLPTASLLATKGFRVLGVDVSESVVNTISRGEIHIVEPELDVLVRSAVQSGNLTASLIPSPAEVSIIAVPTPFRGDHQPDLSYVESATRALAPHVPERGLVILESTSPVGTTEKVAAWLVEERPELAGKVSVAHCPERVLPGHILRELIENDRVVGGVDGSSTDRAAEFYRSFVSGEVLTTTARTAELCKLVENSYRDVNIAFANELSVVSDKLGIDVWDVIALANRHPRVNILRPGPGVGGHCIAVDPWFIIASCPDEARLMRTSREVNLAKTSWVANRVLERASRFKDPVVAILGLAYKPDIDDLRESPALEIARDLSERLEGRLMACEPNITELDGLELVDIDTALSQADIVVALVAHREFRGIDIRRLQDRVVIDAAGALRR